MRDRTTEDLARPGSVPWRSLARALRPAAADGTNSGTTPLTAFLAELAPALGLQRAAWIPAAPAVPGIAGPSEPVARVLDWGWATRIPPGAVGRVRTEDRRRSPRWAATAGFQALARAPRDAREDGLLYLAGAAAPDCGGAELVAWADLAASLAWAARDAESRERDRGARARGRHFGAVAHDLRNQLTLALLQLERATAEPARSNLTALRHVLDAARDLCVTTLSDAEAPPPPRPLVLRSVLVEEARAAQILARPRLAGEADTSAVGVRVRCPSTLRVHADLELLGRLVRNLALNAIEACVAGCEVRLEGRAMPDGSVELEVEDDGRGMTGAELARVFEPGETNSGGTGYGTESLLETLRALSAELVVDSAPRAGTRARVRLSGVPDDDAPAVVVCDADPMRRIAWAEALVAAGLGVWSAANVATALPLVRNTGATLVVLARGSFGPGLAELRQHCRREGVRVAVASATDAPPADQAERVAAMARDGLEGAT